MKVFAIKNFASTTSSSGGAFPAIVEAYKRMVNSDELYIYGAALTEELDVRHIRVKYSDGIEKLKGSKYVQSDISKVFNSIELDLTCERYVVFAGTPCQVEGLNSYLEKKCIDKSRLLSIDLICHGTPQRKFWAQFINLLHEKVNGSIKEIHFRYKSESKKKKSSLVYILEGGKVVNKPKELYTYMRLFSRNLTLYDRCFNCPHRNKEINRPADFTIGDFWGVSEVIPSFKKILGVSLVIPHNEKAQGVILNMSPNNRDIMIEECKTDKWKEYNHNLIVQTRKPKGYSEFWNDFNTITFEELIKKWEKESIGSRIKVFLSNISGKMGIKYKIKHILNILKKTKL